MKNKVKLMLLLGIIIFIAVNFISIRISSTESLNLQSIKTIHAQTECPDDERNVQVNCHIQCPDGSAAYGKMIICREGCIDCTPTECDAICPIIT
jgi:hypothetical protein